MEINSYKKTCFGGQKTNKQPLKALKKPYETHMQEVWWVRGLKESAKQFAHDSLAMIASVLHYCGALN